MNYDSGVNIGFRFITNAHLAKLKNTKNKIPIGYNNVDG